MAADRPFHNPFDVLRSLKTPSADREEERPAAPADSPAQALSLARTSGTIARAVVRMERAGRGGKEVTVIEQLGLSATELASWLKALKSQLGCGGVVEEGAIVLQGDHRKRLPTILSARGVKKVTLG